MKIGPLTIEWQSKRKSWSQLTQIINREKSGGGPLSTNPKAQLLSYKSWVYSCVTLISDRISSLPYSFYNRDTKEELSTKNKNYRIFTKPFRHPNDLMSFRFIKSFCQMQLDLCGITCIFKAYNKLGQVWELWPLNMNEFSKVEVKGSMTNPQVRYYFTLDNGRSMIDFDISELIVINYPHPTNPWAGMSPIQAQAYASDIDTYVEVYERDFFKNNARIDFALTTDAQLNNEKAEEIKSRWREKHAGKYHDIAVLDSGLKLIPIEFTNKDFEFLNLANWSKEKILACYRVPQNKLGSTESNRAGSVYSDISFNRESVHPRLTLWDEEMSMGVCSSYDERLIVQHQNPIPRDRSIEVQESRSYLSGIPSLTINEFREKVHRLGPVDGGDRVIIPKSYIYLDDLSKVTENEMSDDTVDDNPGDVDDDENPNINPDGTDDRDDNPTDGRVHQIEYEKGKTEYPNYEEFYILIDKIRASWNGTIFEALKNSDSSNAENVLGCTLINCLKLTIESLFEYYKNETLIIPTDDWIKEISLRTAKEYNQTLKKNPMWKEMGWIEYFKNQFDSNARLSKIINGLLRSCINYAKWVLLVDQKYQIEWVINSNECGHKGRIIDIVTEDHFKIGVTKMRFPGEILSFNCDCTIKAACRDCSVE